MNFFLAHSLLHTILPAHRQNSRMKLGVPCMKEVSIQKKGVNAKEEEEAT